MKTSSDRLFYIIILMVFTFFALTFNPVSAVEHKSDYIEWVIDKEEIGEAYSSYIQLPNLTIDTYVADLVNEDINSRFLAVAEETNSKASIISEVNIHDDIISISIVCIRPPTSAGEEDLIETYTINYDITNDAIMPFGYLLLKNKIDYKTLCAEVNSKLRDLDGNCNVNDISDFWIDKDGNFVVLVDAFSYPSASESKQFICYYNLDKRELVWPGDAK